MSGETALDSAQFDCKYERDLTNCMELLKCEINFTKLDQVPGYLSSQKPLFNSSTSRHTQLAPSLSGIHLGYRFFNSNSNHRWHGSIPPYTRSLFQRIYVSPCLEFNHTELLTNEAGAKINFQRSAFTGYYKGSILNLRMSPPPLIPKTVLFFGSLSVL